MKSKVKSPEVAKQKGFAHVKKSLKKTIMALEAEPTTEPVQFFYCAGFEYNEGGAQPIMFIGEVPSLWKKWVKTMKTSKEFAAGRCIFDQEEKVLKLEVKLGKGGKKPVLKVVHKLLLKPYADMPIFVNSVDQPDEEAEEVAEDADAANNPDVEVDLEETNIEQYIQETQEYIKEGTEYHGILDDLMSDLEPKLKDISKIIVTDELIDTTKKGFDKINEIDIAGFLKDDLNFQKGIPETLKTGNEELKKALDDLSKLSNKLKTLEPKIAKTKVNADKLQKVVNPVDSDVPPISDNPLENFSHHLGKSIKKSTINSI